MSAPKSELFQMEVDTEADLKSRHAQSQPSNGYTSTNGRNPFKIAHPNTPIHSSESETSTDSLWGSGSDTMQSNDDPRPSAVYHSYVTRPAPPPPPSRQSSESVRRGPPHSSRSSLSASSSSSRSQPSSKCEFAHKYMEGRRNSHVARFESMQQTVIQTTTNLSNDIRAAGNEQAEHIRQQAALEMEYLDKNNERIERIHRDTSSNLMALQERAQTQLKEVQDRQAQQLAAIREDAAQWEERSQAQFEELLGRL